MEQESVWDYPRPPRVEPCSSRIRVEFGGITVADSTAAYRLLETSHPPTYYIPQKDIRMDLLKPGSGRSFCEFKGSASYWDLAEVSSVAWSYAAPSAAYRALKDHLAFYAQKVDACYVDHELARAQEGGFYGGWITSNLKGPFKGAPGTFGW